MPQAGADLPARLYNWSLPDVPNNVTSRFPLAGGCKHKKAKVNNSMAYPSLRARLAGVLRRMAAPLLVSATLVSCGGENFADPQKFYGDLVTAVREKNGGYMYDVLDSARRSEIDTLIGLQMQSLDKLPPEERPQWEALKGKEKRDIYSKMIVEDQSVASMFGGEYKITKIDTLVVLTVEHQGQQPNLMYLRPSNGEYRITFPPRVPDAPFRGAEPPPGAPGNHGGDAPSSGGPDSGAQLK